jgi:hypothetical protein
MFSEQLGLGLGFYLGRQKSPNKPDLSARLSSWDRWCPEILLRSWLARSTDQEEPRCLGMGLGLGLVVRDKVRGRQGLCSLKS